MINKSDLEKTDSGKMFKIYDDWPEIAKMLIIRLKVILENQSNTLYLQVWADLELWEIFLQQFYLKQIYM